MYSDSRKAQHDSFAHHRADLLFARPSQHIAEKNQPSLGQAGDATAAGETLRTRVAAGLHGFVPAAKILP